MQYQIHDIYMCMRVVHTHIYVYYTYVYMNPSHTQPSWHSKEDGNISATHLPHPNHSLPISGPRGIPSPLWWTFKNLNTIKRAELNRHYSEEDIQWPPGTWEKAQHHRHHITRGRNKIDYCRKQKKITKYKYEEGNGTPVQCWWKWKLAQPCAKQSAVPQETKNRTTLGSSHHIPRYEAKENEIHLWKKHKHFRACCSTTHKRQGMQTTGN